MKNALLIIDHGSRFEKANQLLIEVANMVKKKRPNLIIQIAHMELAKPTIDMGVAACVADGATHIVAHPYMLSPGRHASEDIPQLVKTACDKHPTISYSVTDPLGLHDMIGEIILERANL